MLSDKEKRTKYDQFGSQWQQYRSAGGRPEDFNWGDWTQQGGGGFRTVSQEEFSQMFGGGLGGFSDFFEALFGGGIGGRSTGFGSRGQARTQQQVRPRRGSDAEHNLEITLEEA